MYLERFYFTDIGLEYAAKTTSGYILQITRGKYGSGDSPDDFMQLTDLINPLGNMPVSKTETSGNKVTIQTQFSNVTGDEAEPFYLKELGLFARLLNQDGMEVGPENLICYACTEDGEYGDYISGTTTEFIINWPFTISNATNVSVTSESFIYVLRSDFDKLKAMVDSKTHVDVMYRDEEKSESNTIYFIIDKDAPEVVPENINAVSYDNVVFAENTPETATEENWFETESGGDTIVTDTSKIVMQDGLLKVLKEPDENTDFLNK